MDIKSVLLKYVEKIVLGIAVCYLVYTTIYSVIVPAIETHKINARLLSQSNTIESKLKTSKPPPIEMERKEAELMNLRFTTPPTAKPLQQAYILSKFTRDEVVSGITTRDLLNKSELQSLGRLEAAIPGDTEFIYKGGTAELALIQVRKLHNEVWLTECFTVEKGQRIGQKKTVKKIPIDFDTRCKLLEIVPFAQKPMTINKSTVVRNDKGDFLSVKLEPETHAITTPKIVFENKKGEAYNLWVGELVNLGTETVPIRSSTKTSSTK
jgi:hypothetical protein